MFSHLFQFPSLPFPQDCTYPGRGCDGGDPQEAMESLVNHGTALTEAQNPFKAAPTAKCSYGAAGAPRPASTTYAITPQQAKPDENAAGIYLAQNGYVRVASIPPCVAFRLGCLADAGLSVVSPPPSSLPLLSVPWLRLWMRARCSSTRAV